MNQLSFTRKIRSLISRHERAILVLLSALGLTAFLLNIGFDVLEASFFDLRTRMSIASPADPDIILVTLDESSAKKLNEVPPFSLNQHALLMESLERLKPRAVGYLVDLNQVVQADPEMLESPWSQRFLDSANRLRAGGSPVLLGTHLDVTGEALPPYPLNGLPHAIAVIHKDGNVFAEDKVTRRALVSLNEKPAFHLELAKELGAIGADELPRGTYSVPEIDSKYFFFKYHGTPVLKSEHRFALPYARISFSEILSGRLPEGALKGKIVLVGTLLRENPNDYTFTPSSKDEFANPKIVISATILDSILHHEGIVRTPTWVTGLLTFAATTFIFWFVMNLTPLYGVFATLGLSFALAAICQLFFQVRGIWIHESQPLVGILIAYYLAVPYRLIREYRKRWELQRKNQLLVQVEELKTNFLSLVTHDLKTPVARIQGLTEVLLRKAYDRLVERDRETLHHIIQSTEELNRFISSILELNRVESQRLPLNVETKDINQLIERCAEGFKAPARAKQIKIQLELEPLFPIRIDASLISKVMNNLIDNALKYSLPNGDLTIETREVSPWIEISVRDQGVGMTDAERDRLFTRFFRAKNEKTASSGGTGLGLYLSKYFVEAHGGLVEVESEPDRGSVFRIFLPIEGPKSGTIAEPPRGLVTERTHEQEELGVRKEREHV